MLWLLVYFCYIFAIFLHGPGGLQFVFPSVDPSYSSICLQGSSALWTMLWLCRASTQKSGDAHSYLSIYLSIYLSLPLYISTYVYNMCIYTLSYVHVYVTYVYIYIYIFTCVSTYMYVIYIHIYTCGCI